MKKNNFYDIMTVQEKHLDRMQDFIADSEKQLITDFFGDGVAKGLQVVATSPPSMQVCVAPTTSELDPDRGYIGGKQVPVPVTQTLTIAPADPTNPRIDAVVIFWAQGQAEPVTDFYGNTVYELLYDSFNLQVIQGTPAATPVAPATPAGGLLLAHIYIRPGSTAIYDTDQTTNGYIIDKRAFVARSWAEIEAARGTKASLDERLDASLNEDGSLKDNVVTDAKIGNRTIDQTQAPSGNIGLLTSILSWLANRIKAITGKANWYDTPDTTLAAAKSHMDAAAPHSGHSLVGHIHPDATTSASGFMSAADKTKLNGIAPGAEVNQNAFSSVKVVDSSGASKGQVDADTKTDLLTLKEGVGVALSVDPNTDTVTITATGGTAPAAHASTHHSGGSDPLDLGSIAGSITDSQHGNRGGGSLHAVATTNAAGFMSAADKSKLDGLNASDFAAKSHDHDGTDSPNVPWNNVSGKPSTFPPSSHTHSGNDITSKVAAASAADSVPWTGVTGKPSTFPPSSHTHSGSDITTAVASATNADKVDNLDASSFGRIDSATSVNSRWTFNTTNGRLVAPVGTDKWATS